MFSNGNFYKIIYLWNVISINCQTSFMIFFFVYCCKVFFCAVPQLSLIFYYYFCSIFIWYSFRTSQIRSIESNIKKKRKISTFSTYLLLKSNKQIWKVESNWKCNMMNASALNSVRRLRSDISRIIVWRFRRENNLSVVKLFSIANRKKKARMPDKTYVTRNTKGLIIRFRGLD